MVAIMARDAEFNLCLQGLIYPATSFYLNTDSQKRFSTGYLLTKDAQTWYHQQYLRIEADRDDWKASPVFAENLTGVAPAFILTCAYNPLVVREGIRRNAAAGRSTGDISLL